MAKFDAGKAVEKLEYDFSDYGGGKGFIPEPTTKAVNAFFRESRKMMGELTRIKGLGNLNDIDPESLTDEQTMEAMSSIDEVSSATEAMNLAMAGNLAELCGGERDEEDRTVVHGGSPSQGDLENLPFRVLQAFSTWLMGELRPKKTTPGGKR